jgi:ParB-like nuclease domain/CBS domain
MKIRDVMTPDIEAVTPDETLRTAARLMADLDLGALPVSEASYSPLSRARIMRAREGREEWPADQVERWPVAKLIPYARNARTHSEDQIKQIAASIREFGFTNPVLIDEEDGIIAGHGRVLAAHLLKLIAQIVGSIARVQPANYQQQRAGDYYRHSCCEFRARHLSILRPCFPFRGKPA